MRLGTWQPVIGLGMCLVLARALQGQAPPKIASLGACRLESGASIPDCRVAYRTFGQLNATRTNVILIPTWLLGRSEEWISLLGQDGIVDTTNFFVVVVAALGNGESSSPSNTKGQGRDAFARLSIGDMVVSQRRLLQEHLGVAHLRATLGYSMGGMQAFEWAARFPTEVDLAIPIAGSPRVGTFDRLLWTTFLEEVESGTRAGLAPVQIWRQVSRLITLFLQTPSAVDGMNWDSVQAQVGADAEQRTRNWDLADFAAQLRAIQHYALLSSSATDMAQVTSIVRARMLIIGSPDDHVVTAGASRLFAPLVHADTLWLASSCGHSVLFCERPAIAAAIQRFLTP